MKAKKLLAILLAGALALSVAGCNGNSNSSTSGEESTPASTSGESSTGESATTSETTAKSDATLEIWVYLSLIHI